MAKKNTQHYVLSANLGSAAAPFPIMIPVGDFEHSSAAFSTACDMLKNCTSQIKWKLLEGGKKDTGHRVNTGPKPERGTELIIHIAAETRGDVEEVLEQVSRDYQCWQGFDSNETSSYSFERFGEFVEDAEDEE
jgi:hypothetical protein